MEKSSRSESVHDHLESHIVSVTFHLVAISFLAYLLGRRTFFFRENKNSAKLDFLHMDWERISAMMVLANSWCFALVSGILVNGVGRLNDKTSCNPRLVKSAAIFYASTKLFTYCFLAEKAYVVWKTKGLPSRYNFGFYLFCIFGLIVYGFAFMVVVGSDSQSNSQEACLAGLKEITTLSLAFLDIILNHVLIGLIISVEAFLKITAAQAKRGSFAILPFSTGSKLVLMAQVRELLRVGMAVCVVELIVDALVIFRMTPGPSARKPKTPQKGDEESNKQKVRKKSEKAAKKEESKSYQISNPGLKQELMVEI